MKYLLTIGLLCSFNQAAALGFMNGNNILEYCEAYLSETGSAAKGNGCYGFVTGVADAHYQFTLWDEMSTQWCQPDNMTASQLIRIVTKHLQEYPEDLHSAAAGLVSNALILAFPCE